MLCLFVHTQCGEMFFKVALPFHKIFIQFTYYLLSLRNILEKNVDTKGMLVVYVVWELYSVRAPS